MEDCPIEKYRKYSNLEKLRLSESLSDEDIDEIFDHHNKCLLDSYVKDFELHR